MNALLARYASTPSYTRGILTIEGEVFYTLELPWKLNARNISRIPSGDYYVSFLTQSASGKYKNVFHIECVPARGGILIHNGNVVAHTKGCVLVGSKAGRLGGQPAVLGSNGAMNKLCEITNCEGFLLKVLGEK